MLHFGAVNNTFFYFLINFLLIIPLIRGLKNNNEQLSNPLIPLIKVSAVKDSTIYDFCHSDKDLLYARIKTLYTLG
jgi:hypothetical protein